MTYNFADSFDPYAALGDMILGYWDSQNTAGQSLVAGRFTGSRALSMNGAGNVIKSSGQNDAVHHFCVAFMQTTALSGTTLGNYILLYDGASANQCSVVFRSDGVILLTSGGPAGTVLDTWTGAFTGNNIWYAFEFEVVVNNTTGSWAIRRGGNSVNDHAATGLNTRGGTTNNYANKVQIGQLTSGFVQIFDDFYWQSGSATGNWLGDLRCLVRMPASDQSIQFSRLTPYNQFIAANPSGTVGVLNGTAMYTSFTPPVNGTLGSLNLPMALGYTGNLKCSIFLDNGANFAGVTVGSPATVLVNPATGNNTITFPTPVPLTRATKYWVGVDSDTSSGTYQTDNVGNDAGKSTTAYASFPVNNPASSGLTSALAITLNMVVTDNWSEVAEAQQNAAATYVYDSTVNDADFYGIATVGVTPTTIIATVVRALMQKSDTGSRTGAVQLKSGSATVTAPAITLTNSGWLWSYRLDLVDPNTSAAWTAIAVNNAQIGPKVIS